MVNSTKRRMIYFVMAIALILMCTATDTAVAGGDKVRGAKGQGEVYQYQNRIVP